MKNTEKKNTLKMNLSNLWILFLLQLVIYSNMVCDGAIKILGIFPIGSKSHSDVATGAMKSLIDAGHQVTIISPLGRELSKENYTSIIDLSDTIPVPRSKLKYNLYHERGDLDLFQQIGYEDRSRCHKVFNNKAFQELMSSESASFDVIFVEIHVYYKCYLPLARKLNATVIGITPWRSWSIGDLAMKNPHHPADVPGDIIKNWRFDDFYSRLNNLRWYIVIRYLRIFDEYYEDKLWPYEGYSDIEPVLMFYNSHHSILPRANNPNIIEIGGIQVKPAKPLPQKIQKFIDEAQHGAILFTFGSLAKASTLPASFVSTFLQVFSSIPQRVIWKYEEPLENVPDNVMILDWLPQRDILEHPNVKAFISHCGPGGMYEAIYTATPVISCPLMLDQLPNAAVLEHLGVAVHLDIHSITRESLLTVINLIINDTKYYDKMQKVSQAFQDRPLTPQQSVVFWTEYVIKHKDTLNLMPPSGRLNFFQYYLLDVMSLVILTFVALAIIVRWTIKMFLRFISRKISLYFQFKNKAV